MTRIFAVFFFLTFLEAQAMPVKFEVWFLSTSSAKEATTYLEPTINFSSSMAQTNLQCQPMGDYCFDPQVGLYKMGEGKQVQQELDYQKVEEMENYKNLPTAESLDRQLIKCEDGNLFDLYCGKAKATRIAKTKVELWIDVSSTMKQVDFDGYDQMCKREAFLKLMDTKCSFNQEMKVYIFDEVRKELGTMDRVCLNAGLNKVERIIRDIKTSEAKHLIIITDIFEANTEFINFIETSGHGTIKGLDKPMYAEDLKSQVTRLQKSCL